MCCISHPNAATERTFSKYNLIKDNKRNRLQVEVIESLIKIKESSHDKNYQEIGEIANSISIR